MTGAIITRRKEFVFRIHLRTLPHGLPRVMEITLTPLLFAFSLTKLDFFIVQVKLYKSAVQSLEQQRNLNLDIFSLARNLVAPIKIEVK